MSIKNGEYKSYRLIENYKNGELHGKRLYFYPNGNIHQKAIYINGKISSLVVYNEQQQITYSSAAF